jgi:alcohol dehydrogenase class IV
MNYEFLSPARIVFGWGRRAEAGRLARDLGTRAFLVTGSRTLERLGKVDELCEALRQAGVSVVRLASIEREPRVADVDSTLVQLLAHQPAIGDFVVGFGGGSAIDLAKAVAALATNRHGVSVRDFLEGVGCGLAINQAPLPLLAIPTTAGTGSEATKNAVISGDDPPFKKSLRSDRMVPSAVLIDPELTTSLPPHVTAHTGMDAITQLIESYISRRARPIPRALALSGLSLAGRALPEAFHHPTNRPARERMAHAALLSGMALANAGLGMAHGVAAALGVHCQTPHGLACAVMLPVALRANRPVCEEALAQVARPLTGRVSLSRSAAADAVIAFVDGLCDELRIPRRLSQIGVRREQLPELVRSSRGSSMDGNPRALCDDELRDILSAIL